MKKNFPHLIPFLLGTLPVSFIFGVLEKESLQQILLRCVVVSGITFLLYLLFVSLNGIAFMKKNFQLLFPFLLGTLPVSFIFGVLEKESLPQILVRCVVVSGISFLLLLLFFRLYWIFFVKSRGLKGPE